VEGHAQAAITSVWIDETLDNLLKNEEHPAYYRFLKTDWNVMESYFGGELCAEEVASVVLDGMAVDDCLEQPRLRRFFWKRLSESRYHAEIQFGRDALYVVRVSADKSGRWLVDVSDGAGRQIYSKAGLGGRFAAQNTGTRYLSRLVDSAGRQVKRLARHAGEQLLGEHKASSRRRGSGSDSAEARDAARSSQVRASPRAGARRGSRLAT